MGRTPAALLMRLLVHPRLVLGCSSPWGWFRREKGVGSESGGVDQWQHLPTPDIPSDLERELMADDSAHGLARAVWAERAFPAMGWHDATVWAYEVRAVTGSRMTGPVRLLSTSTTSWGGLSEGDGFRSGWPPARSSSVG